MKYLGTILALCLVVFGAFAIYKYTPDMVSGAQTLASGIFNLLNSSNR